MTAKTKRPANVHAPKSPKGMGDYYGTGVKAKVGKMRDSLGFEAITPSKEQKPPRSLA